MTSHISLSYSPLSWNSRVANDGTGLTPVQALAYSLCSPRLDSEVAQEPHLSRFFHLPSGAFALSCAELVFDAIRDKKHKGVPLEKEYTQDAAGNTEWEAHNPE
ncbi:MAG TPA: hypothetical protein VEA59_02560 [Patescibacteria group bacterium]|nr:hypothetical protein [Patescibacteria group bacterium]